MKDIILDTLLDGIKLIPFLFIAFLIIELIEHKYSKKTKKIVSNSGKFGPIIGGVLGAFPQCGFSVMATNLYITRIISLGTLISIYLSTSDEMLPILISEGVSFSFAFKIILIKLSIGIAAGFIIDFILRNKNKNIELDSHICEDEHCHCDHGLIKPVIKHTINILIFIMIVTFALNLLFEYVGEDNLSKLFLKNSIFGPFIASIIGLIPNCGASVILTELYLKNAISLGSGIAGLLTGSGVAILVLFKSNKNLKENLSISLIIYTIGVLSGIVIELIGMIL
jgi:hypothetical protein